MKKTILSLSLMALMIGFVLATNAAALPKFSLTLTGLTGDRDGNGFTYVGPGARVDIGLGLFTLSPEISYFPGNGGGLVPGATLNIKIWKLFAGAGAMPPLAVRRLLFRLERFRRRDRPDGRLRLLTPGRG